MAATVAASLPRIEIVSEHRRAHDAAFRARVFEASWQPGISVRELARQHGICTSLIYRWRRATAPPIAVSAVAADRPLEFVPIGMFGRADDESPALITGPPIGAAPVVHHAAPPRAVPAMETRSGLIEIDLADGTRLRVDAFVNERALRRVLSVLKAIA